MAATRFYLPATEAAAVNPANTADWTHVQGSPVYRRLQKPYVAVALATTAVTPDSSDHLVAGASLHRTYVSDPLAAQTIAGNVKAQFQTLEAHANNNLFLTLKIFRVDSTGTLQDVLLAITSKGTEPTTSLRNTAFASAALTSRTFAEGDRLAIEIGLAGTPGPAASQTQGHNGSIRWGTTAASGDLPEDESQSGTGYRPWIEFDSLITFAPARPTATIDAQSGIAGTYSFAGPGAIAQSVGVSPLGTDSATTIQATLPNPVAVGSLIFVFVSWGDPTSDGTVSLDDDQGSNEAWNALGAGPRYDSAGAALTASQAFYLKNAVAGSTTITATFNTSRQYRAIIVVELTLMDTTAPLVDFDDTMYATISAVGTDGAVTANVSPDGDGQVILGGVVTTATTSENPAAGTGFTQWANTYQTNHPAMEGEYFLQGTAADKAATWTFAVQRRYNAVAAVFKIAGGAAVYTPVVSIAIQSGISAIIVATRVIAGAIAAQLGIAGTFSKLAIRTIAGSVAAQSGIAATYSKLAVRSINGNIAGQSTVEATYSSHTAPQTYTPVTSIVAQSGVVATYSKLAVRSINGNVAAQSTVAATYSKLAIRTINGNVPAQSGVSATYSKLAIRTINGNIPGQAGVAATFSKLAIRSINGSIAAQSTIQASINVTYKPPAAIAGQSTIVATYFKSTPGSFQGEIAAQSTISALVRTERVYVSSLSLQALISATYSFTSGVVPTGPNFQIGKVPVRVVPTWEIGVVRCYVTDPYAGCVPVHTCTDIEAGIVPITHEDALDIGVVPIYEA